MDSAASLYQAIHRHLVAKAARDDDFRKALLADPKHTVAAEIARSFPEAGQLPPNLKINVIEPPSDTIVLVLPPKAAVGADELSDADLEAVSGGYDSPRVTCNDTCGVASMINTDC